MAPASDGGGVTVELMVESGIGALGVVACIGVAAGAVAAGAGASCGDGVISTGVAVWLCGGGTVIGPVEASGADCA